MSDVTPDRPDSEREISAAERALGQHRVITMIRWLLYLLFVIIAYRILSYLAPVLTPVLVAGGIAYLLDPLVDRLENAGMKRVWAVTLLLVTFLGSIGVAIVVLVPLVSDDLARFIDKLPEMVSNAALWISSEFGIEVPKSWQDYMSSDEVKAVLEKLSGPATSLAAAAVGGIFAVLAILAEMLLIPVFAFYFLLDWDHIVARLRSMIPPRHRAQVVDVVGEIDSVVSSWIRGQFTVTSILAVLYAACFYVCGVQLAIPVGLLVGALTIIPFLGTFVGLGITMILLVLDWQGGGQLAAVGAVFVVLHLLEAAFLTPKIVGKKVGLGESGALFAVLAGGQLLGFTGVLLAVPLAASVAVLIRRLMKYYEKSQFFGSEEDDETRPPELPSVASPIGLPDVPRRGESAAETPDPTASADEGTDDTEASDASVTEQVHDSSSHMFDSETADEPES